MKKLYCKFLPFIGIVILASSCEKTDIPLMGINLSKTTLFLEVDSSQVLSIEMDPLNATDKTLIWTSSDTTIAKVNFEGVISGISPGKADITVKTKEGIQETCTANIVRITSFDIYDEIDLGGNPFIAFDNFNNLWYGGLGGVYRMNPDGHSGEFLPLNTQVLDMVFDSENNLWAATYTMGLLKYDGQTWSSYNTSNSKIPTDRIPSINIDHEKNIWIGISEDRFYNNKIAKFDGTLWTIYDSEECFISDYYPYDIIADQQNNLWFGHYFGVSMFDGVEWKVFKDIERFRNIIDMDTDIENNIWFVSPNNGVFKYDGKDLFFYNINNTSLSLENTLAVKIDKKGVLWFGNRRGALVFNGEEWIGLDFHHFSIHDIRDIGVDNENNKWLMSTQKIYKLED